ncbi:FxSxx-COOH system tetratricopeptide repeat protein [Actinoplanes subtropicus]|uniref:FxSxx-COOH system tetratricopeptide repeat protein n=1 Tax=Actinoplanes subtropicus TaxID=543632 RepID=UPI000A883141|nr:FxSxx-COOH system tetratricopeptide repeat protein [Actinoplanes subtropicus]
MAIALPGRDRLPPGPNRDFVEAMHLLYDLAGRPAARAISRAIFKQSMLESVSHETVSAVLRGDKIPTWGKVQSIVTVLAVMAVSEQNLATLLRDTHRLWIRTRPAQRPEPAVPAPEPAPEPEAVPPPLPPAPGLDADRVAGPAEQPIVGSLPERNSHFTGREILLDTMRQHHQNHPHAPLVLYGLGGVGKTQLAREYVHRFADQYSVVWWVPSDRPEQARASLVSLAERLGLPLRHNSEQTIAGVLGRLESQQVNYLLVFDGAEGDDIRGFLPSVGGNVIVTSRDPAWSHGSGNMGLEVPDFDLAEAIQFLRKRDGQMTGHQAGEVTQRLGRLPLALEGFAALRLATEQSWDDLLAGLDDPEPQLLSSADAEPAHYPYTVAAALQIALDRLDTANPAAVLVFELFAWFGSEPVSIPLLRRGAAGDVSPRLRRTLSNPIELRRAVQDINKFGLGRLHTEDQRIEVQPLMRLALRDALSGEDQERARQNVQEILTAADQGWPDDLGLWDMHRAMAPHVLPADLIHAHKMPALVAVHHQIRYRYLIGDYDDARRLGEAAVQAWRGSDLLGPDHGLVLLATREWANALRALGRYRQARELTADAMQRLRANPQYGEDHPYALDMARSHAADLRIAGEYQQALAVDQASWQRHVLRYGAEHDRTIASRHNLAVSLRLLGDFAAAEEVDRQEVNHHRRFRGEGDRLTLLSVNALAEDLYGLGRYRDVIEVQTRSLEIGQRLLRPGDHGILHARRTIALARRRMGAVDVAAELLRETYDELVASFGADHEYTLATVMSYANALRDRRRPGEAYAYAVDAVTAYEHAFGSSNPLTLAAQVNLAVVLRARGERYQARRADEAAYRGLSAGVGERHPFTIVAMINLATDMALADERDAALTLSERAWSIAKEVRGIYHSDTLAAAANLTIDRRSPGASAPTLDEVLADLRRTLGRDHSMVADVAAGIRIECDIEPPST